MNGNRMKKPKTCMAYVMHEDRQLGCPDIEYFDLLRGGYSDWEFPLDTLKRGLAASIGRTDVSEEAADDVRVHDHREKTLCSI